MQQQLQAQQLLLRQQPFRPAKSPRTERFLIRCSAESDEISRRAAVAGGSAILGSAALSLATNGNAVAAPLAPFAPGPMSDADTLPAIPHKNISKGLPGQDLEVSQVIKGCWQLSGGHRGDAASDRTSGSAAVEDFGKFVNAGIDTLDCADHYGDAEAIIGRYLKQDGTENVKVLTKACIWGSNLGKVGSGDTLEKEYIDRSRERLGRSKLDLLQFYWHDYGNKQYVDAALKLRDMKGRGKIANIGVTNFDVTHLAKIVDAGVPIVSNQVQYSLLDRRPQNGMIDYCRENGIAILPYGVVAGGLLSDRYLGAEPAKMDFNTSSLRKYASVLQAAGGWKWYQRLLRELRAVGDNHGGVSIANVASRWVLERDTVGALILGARNASHVADHRALFSFQLDEEDYDRINTVLALSQPPDGDCYTWERGGRF
mmetsp:Transcript_20291/g.61132  ORF Transcript_20291/g.61132 Transcript_20291/m.61132 type:complete len:428 (+) Transcript_20291:121-1404(+)